MKKIKFIAADDHCYNVRSRPVPASKMLPDWWKSMSPFAGSDKSFNFHGAPNSSVKKCIPTLDALNSGYVYTLWSDVIVENVDGEPLVQWNVAEPVFSTWEREQVSGYEIPKGFSETVFKYHHGWNPKTPRGWSLLFSQPFGYSNTPFQVLPGIVDTDSLRTGVYMPMVIEKGFEGVIRKGTPMFQITPIKREFWISSFGSKTARQSFFDSEKLHSTMVSSYAKNHWSRKSYR